MSTALERIDRQRERLEDMLDSLSQRKISVIRNQDWKCRAKGCGRPSPLSSVVLVRTYWYTPPHGCTGGDYWNAGERNLICPKCSVRHRMIEQDPRPADYYDFSYEKQRKIDATRKVAMEREYGIADGVDSREIFDNIIDDYDDAFYEVRRGGEEPVRSGDRRTRLSAAEVAALFGFSPQAFASFVKV